MRLPGVQYGQVQSMGRQNTNAPALEAASINLKLKAKQGVANTISGHADALYKAESERQFNRSRNKYNSAYDEQMVDVEITEEVWQNREEVFAEASGGAQQASDTESLTGLAREKMRQYSAAKSVQNKNVWDKQNHAWWMKDGLAQAETQVADHINAKEWDSASQTINDATVFYGPQRTASLLAGVQGMKSFAGYEIRAKGVDITSVAQGSRTAKLIQDINSNGHIDAKAKTELTNMAEQEVINAHRDSAVRVGIAEMKKTGAIGAAELVATIGLKALNTQPESFGISFRAKHDLVLGLNQELNHFKSLIDETQKGVSTQMVMANYRQTMVTKEHNQEVAQLAAGMSMFFMKANKAGTGLDKGSKPPGADAALYSGAKIYESLKPGDKLVDGRTKIIQHALHDAHIVPQVSNYLSAIARTQGPEGMSHVMGIIHELQETREGRASLNSLETDNELKDILGLSEVIGLDNPKSVQALYKDGLQRTTAEKTEYWKNRNAGDDRKEFEKNLKSGLNKAYKTGSYVFGLFGTATPDTQKAMQDGIWAITKEFMVNHPTFSVEQATTAALKVFSNEYDVTRIGGGNVLKQNSAERVFATSDCTPDETAEWVDESIRAQMPELPKVYDYKTVRKSIRVNGEAVGVNMIQPFTHNEDGTLHTYAPILPRYKGTKVHKQKTRNNIITTQAVADTVKANKSGVEKAIQIRKDVASGKLAPEDAEIQLLGLKAVTWGSEALTKVDTYISTLHGEAYDWEANEAQAPEAAQATNWIKDINQKVKGIK